VAAAEPCTAEGCCKQSVLVSKHEWGFQQGAWSGADPGQRAAGEGVLLVSGTGGGDSTGRRWGSACVFSGTTHQRSVPV
jgi:hypothetical protein